MRPTKWTKWVAIASVTVLLTSGCSLLKSNESQEIDPPQTRTGLDGTASPTNASVQQGAAATIFAKDHNNYIVPVSIQMEKTMTPARMTLEYMVDGGAGARTLPAGFTNVLPKGTSIKGLDINEETKVATVDFSKEFLNYEAKDERKVLEAVTWALTGFPNVKEVNIWVGGKPLKEMPQGHLPINGTLTRAMGINIEKAEGVEFGQTTPVTLYFLGQTDNLVNYYVPVTRMVQRTEDKAHATLEQLILGPAAQSALSAVMAPSIDVPSIETADGLLTVNFSDTLLGPDDKAPGEAVQSVILSLTELAGNDAKVQIKVNGSAKVSTTDSSTYSEPVSRPVTINDMKM